MSDFHLYIPGRVVGWKAANKGRGHFFSPQPFAEYRDKVKTLARLAWGDKPPRKETCRLSLLYFYDKRPPDSDNVEKGLRDALQGIVYKNDSQVMVVNIRAVKAHYEQELGAYLTIEWIR